jgi:hypothetical protein
MSIRSVNETEQHLRFARDIGVLSPGDWHRLSAETIEIRKMIYGYRKKVLSRDRTDGPPREQRQPVHVEQEQVEQEQVQQEHRQQNLPYQE